MISEENIITEFIQHSTGFTISKSDLINGKVVVNNIEITSIEDWNKVIKSLFELQQENKELHNKIDKAIEFIKLLGKFDGEHCTRNFKMMSADFNYLLKILKDSDIK